MKLLSLFILLAACVAQADETYDLVVLNTTVIDAVSPERVNHSVFVKDGTIVRVALSGSEAYSAAHVIDGTGKYLIPGLWDMHVHIVYEKELIQLMPSLFLDYGVTNVRDTGALLSEILPEVSRWQALGKEAPDLYFSGPLLDGKLVVYDGDGRTEIGIRNANTEMARRNVQQLKQAGADFIKIYELVDLEVFSALTAAARDLGLPIAAHVPLSMTAQTAGPLVDSMEHLRNIELACASNANQLHATRQQQIRSPGDRSGYELRRDLHAAQRAAAHESADPASADCRALGRTLRRTIQVPTLRLNTITNFSPAARADWTTHLDRLPESVANSWLATAERFAGQPSQMGMKLSDWSLRLVSELNNAGVPIGAGTDTPIGQAIPGYSLHTELERLVTAGLSTREALRAATIQPAMFFGKENEMGQIAVGMEADLVMLDKNPLHNIEHTRLVRAVISNGEPVR